MREVLHIPAELAGRVWPYRGPVHGHRPHRHDELEFNLVLRGTGRYIVGDRRVDLGPGSLVWLFPGQEHVLLDESGQLQMWIAVFRSALVRRVARDREMRTLRQADPPGRHDGVLWGATYDRLEALCREVHEQADHPDHHNAALGYLLTTAWRAREESEAAGRGATLHPAVDQAARLLRRAEAPRTLDELAEAVGLSASRLSRLFSAQIGMSIPDYRNRGRLDRFMEASAGARETDMLHGALACGFGSYAQFHRAFKRHMGCGPAEWKRRTRRTDDAGGD